MKAYFNNIEKQIISHIELANKSIYIAVAWFTNYRIFNLLKGKLEDNVEIKIILRDDHINNSTKSLQWKSFNEKGGELYFYSLANIFHHKFCIIDGVKLINGSYNWTLQAEKINKENVIFSTDENLVFSFNKEYEKLVRESIKPVKLSNP